MAYPYSSSATGRKETLASPGKLWRRIPQEHRLEACAAFWQEDEAVEQQAEALLAVATHFRFRPKSVRALPLEKKARYLASLPGVPDSVAGRVLVAYHLAHQRPMLAAFLDALGVAHDNGVLTAEKLTPPEADRLKEAAAKLRAGFPAADVDLYFQTLVGQDPEMWGGLADLVGGEEAK
jgi:hypothetical protein